MTITQDMLVADVSLQGIYRCGSVTILLHLVEPGSYDLSGQYWGSRSGSKSAFTARFLDDKGKRLGSLSEIGGPGGIARTDERHLREAVQAAISFATCCPSHEFNNGNEDPSTWTKSERLWKRLEDAMVGEYLPSDDQGEYELEELVCATLDDAGLDVEVKSLRHILMWDWDVQMKAARKGCELQLDDGMRRVFEFRPMAMEG